MELILHITYIMQTYIDMRLHALVDKRPVLVREDISTDGFLVWLCSWWGESDKHLFSSFANACLQWKRGVYLYYIYDHRLKRTYYFIPAPRVALRFGAKLPLEVFVFQARRKCRTECDCVSYIYSLKCT